MNRFRMTAWMASGVLLLLPAGVAAASPEAPLAGLPQAVEESMREWRVPGLAMAVVRDDEILFQGGFGTRRTGAEEPVDTGTLFAIGSASKAFTATALAMLVDEGKVDWDAPVVDYMPGFRLSDPWISEHVALRDMLSHQTGLPGADILWVWSEGYLSREELVGRLRHQPITLPFRAKFEYNNLVYLASGRVIPAVTGLSWDNFVRRRIFEPLGMEASSTSVAALEGKSNVARPHLIEGGEVVEIPYRNIDAIASAGAINSNVEDMVKWVRFQLDGGKVGETPLLRKEALDALRKPRFAMPIPEPFEPMPGAHFLGYGMGWFLHDYRGVKLVEHGGNIDGMTSLVALIPEKRIGLVILTNLNTTRIREVLMYTVFDRLLGLPPTDWNAHFLDLEREVREKARGVREEKAKARREGTSTSLPLEAYAGVYHSDFYGDVLVTLDGGALSFGYQDRAVPLEHWHFDTFRRPYYSIEAPGIELVTFALGPEGTVAALTDDVMGRFERVGEEGPEERGAGAAFEAEIDAPAHGWRRGA